MALTKADVEMWDKLAAIDAIPANPAILEIGEANWFGDVAPAPEDYSPNLFEVAKKYYARIFKPREQVAIDFRGPTSLKLDLNHPISIEGDEPGTRKLFDLIINTGTLEHVFNQGQAFKTVHEHCAVNGVMMHAVPWTGWVNHGFFCYQPCFFHDLAGANGYEILHSMEWRAGMQKTGELEVTDNVMLYVALRKLKDLPFQYPIQSGRNGGPLPEAG